MIQSSLDCLWSPHPTGLLPCKLFFISFPSNFHNSTCLLFSHALPLPLTLAYSVPTFLKCKSITQSGDVWTAWCQCDQRPRSLWIWVLSRINGAAVSTSGWMMTQYISTTMIMRTTSFIWWDPKTLLLQNSNNSILNTQTLTYFKC